MTVNFMKFGLLMPQLLAATDWRWYYYSSKKFSLWKKL